MSKRNKEYRVDGAEGSQYWKWVNDRTGATEGSHLVREFPDANPDVLSENNAMVKKAELSEEDEETLAVYYRLVDAGMLKKLAPRQREIWKLRFFKWFTDEEIAKKLGISLSAVRSHLARAAIKIRQEVEKKQKRKAMLDGNYFNDGFKKGVHEVGEAKTDKDMADRLERGEKEIQDFLRKHPELRNG